MERFFLSPRKTYQKISKVFKRRGVKRVLDLGCGTGRHIINFVKKGFEIYGIDIAEEGIEITKKWLKKEGLEANLKVGSIYKRLPYKNSFFLTQSFPLIQFTTQELTKSKKQFGR